MSKPVAEPAFSVLLVDDNEVIQLTCGAHLEQEGYAVVRAEDGAQALGLLEKTSVDLVLLDVMMPGLSGFEVLEILRQKHSPDELPVIMATAKDQNADVVRAFDLGANDYVTKPIDFPVLSVRIRAQLRSRRQRRETASGTDPATPRIPEAELALETGALLDGKYRLEALIGHGSYGIVYQSRHVSLDRLVAIKVLDRSVTGGKQMLQRFRREGVSACRIDHRNAVSVLDSSVTSTGVPYLVMELLRGRTLEAELRRKGRLPPGRCGEILFSICDVLGEAHDLGIIHRDVKPQNVFLHQSRRGEVVKVLDFGLAKLIGDPGAHQEITPEGGVVGTPIYMAPERLLGGTLGGSSDVYSLGVMLYEMLAGQLPFKQADGNPIKLVLKHITEPPVPLLAVCPELPEPVGEIVHEALEKEPEKRPAVRELGRRFAAALELEPPDFLMPVTN